MDSTTSGKAYTGILPGLYVASGKWLEWLPSKMLRLYRALWLGLLDADGLTEVTRLSYLGRSGFEEEAFNVETGLWPWEEAAVSGHFRPGSRVLVVAGGGGREVIALVRRGFEVTACDFSRDLTEACRRNLERVALRAEVFDMLPNTLFEGMGPFDGVIFGRGFYHHIPTTKRRIGLLVAARGQMPSGAPLFISDFHTRSAHSPSHTKILRVASWVTRWRASAASDSCPEGEEQIPRSPLCKGSTATTELGDWLTTGFQHAFTEEEIQGELAAAGFDQVDFRVSPFSTDSNLAHVVARVPQAAANSTSSAHSRSTTRGKAA